MRLDLLPPDIIRVILHRTCESFDELRLISPAWNVCILEYLSRLGTLERVYLFPAKTGEKEQQENRLQMATILPVQHILRIGLSKWLSVYMRHGQDAVEVVSSGERIRNLRDKSRWTEMMQAITLCFLLLSLILTYFYSYVGLPLCVCSYCVCCWPTYRSELRRKNMKSDLSPWIHSPRLARFISMFTTIDCVVLEDLNINRLLLDSIPPTLGAVRIKRMEVREREVDDSLQTLILALCHKHAVQQLFIRADVFCVKEFRAFVLRLTNLGITLDIYEGRRGAQHNQCFRMPRDFWTEMAREQLIQHKVSLRLATCQDVEFRNKEYRFKVSSHMRVEKANASSGLPLRAVKCSRGSNVKHSRY